MNKNQHKEGETMSKRLRANRLSHLASGTVFPTPAQVRAREQLEESQRETKHTPGPWTVYHDRAGHDLVSVCPVDNSFEYVFGHPANAALIASAPDLLAALKEAKYVLERAGQYFPKSVRNADRFSLLNVLANAVDPAIAKAEGR